MQLGAPSAARGIDPIDHHGLRRLARIAALSSERHLRLRSLVVIMERHGHARMASVGGSDVSRLTLGIAESRAFQALMRGESEPRDPRVLVVPFPRGRSLAGLVRFESVDAIDAGSRVALGIEALRLAITIEVANALSLGDCTLRPDQPATALIAADGAVLSANQLFDALAPAAGLIDELGTTMRDRDALRRLVDQSAVSDGAGCEATLRIGPAARAVTVRCASLIAEAVVVTIVDAATPARVQAIDPVRTATRLPTATLDRTTLRAVEGNAEGVRLFSGIVTRLPQAHRLDFLASTVNVTRVPTWLETGGRFEVTAIASERNGVPTLVALARP